MRYKHYKVKCNKLCGRKFKNAAALAQHKCENEFKKPEQCSHCDKWLRSLNNHKCKKASN